MDPGVIGRQHRGTVWDNGMLTGSSRDTKARPRGTRRYDWETESATVWLVHTPGGVVPAAPSLDSQARGAPTLIDAEGRRACTSQARCEGREDSNFLTSQRPVRGRLHLRL